MNRLKIENLLNINETIAKPLFQKYIYPWEILPNISEFILDIGKDLSSELYYKPKENVWIAKDANIAESASISGPTIICSNAEIRHCAFLRGNVIVGENTVIGNSVELKNVIVFNKAQIPHYNYVGDSIVGYKSHLGAQALTSNVKSDKTLTTIKVDNQKIETGLKKFGSVIGDNVEVGCSTVLNPATIIGRNTNIYPLSSVRGYIKENSIYKNKSNIVSKF